MATGLHGESKRISRRQLLQAGLAGIGVVGIWNVAACAPAPSAPPAAPAKAPAVATTGAPPAVSTTAPAAKATSAAAPTAAVAGAPKRGGNFVASENGEIKFDPYFTGQGRYVYFQIFNALFDYRGPDPTTPNPQLAQSWEETDKTLTIKLRQGVKFHNGRELTSQDVVDNVARAKDKSIGHSLFTIFDSSVDGAEAVDKYTVKIVYKKTYPLKLHDLTTFLLIPKEGMADVATKPIGSGPFKFASYTPGDKLEMVRNDDYWDTGQPNVDKITVKIITDPQARVANLLTGSIDMIEQLSLPDVPRLKAEGKIEIANAPTGFSWYINVLNCAKKPFDNKLVRQAMNFSIDREKINKLAFFGLMPVTQCRFLPSSPWYNAKACTSHSFDLAKAKALLDQAGFSGGFETSILVNDSVIPGSKGWAQVWAQDLAKIGVTMKIVERESGPFFDDYNKGNYEITGTFTGGAGFDPSANWGWSSTFRVADNKANIQTQPFFEEYKKLQAEAINSIDPKVRKPAIDKILEMISDESWAVYVAFREQFTGLSKRVKGYRLDISGRPYFGNLWIEGA